MEVRARQYNVNDGNNNYNDGEEKDALEIRGLKKNGKSKSAVKMGRPEKEKKRGEVFDTSWKFDLLQACK